MNNRILIIALLLFFIFSADAQKSYSLNVKLNKPLIFNKILFKLTVKNQGKETLFIKKNYCISNSELNSDIDIIQHLYKIDGSEIKKDNIAANDDIDCFPIPTDSIEEFNSIPFKMKNEYSIKLPLYSKLFEVESKYVVIHYVKLQTESEKELILQSNPVYFKVSKKRKGLILKMNKKSNLNLISKI